MRRIDHALILRRFRFGESSLVIHVATRNHGRVHLLAKGAYRPTARYYAALDLFDTLELDWQETHGRELATLHGATITKRRHRIAHELERYRAALTVLELLDSGIQESAVNAELFVLGETALDRLLFPSPPQRVLVEFELGFLQNLGLAPALLECASCAGPAPATGARGSRRAEFSAQCGGRLCAGCAAEARAIGRRVGTLPESVLLDATRLAPTLGVPRQAGDDSELSSKSLLHLRDAVARFLEYQLQGRPKSYRTFLSSPQRNAPR